MGFRLKDGGFIFRTSMALVVVRPRIKIIKSLLINS